MNGREAALPNGNPGICGGGVGEGGTRDGGAFASGGRGS